MPKIVKWDIAKRNAAEAAVRDLQVIQAILVQRGNVSIAHAMLQSAVTTLNRLPGRWAHVEEAGLQELSKRVRSFLRIAKCGRLSDGSVVRACRLIMKHATALEYDTHWRCRVPFVLSV